MLKKVTGEREQRFWNEEKSFHKSPEAVGLSGFSLYPTDAVVMKIFLKDFYDKIFRSISIDIKHIILCPLILLNILCQITGIILI